MKILTAFLLFTSALCQEKSFKKDLILALKEEHEGPKEFQRLRRATNIEKFNAAAVAFTRYGCSFDFYNFDFKKESYKHKLFIRVY